MTATIDPAAGAPPTVPGPSPQPPVAPSPPSDAPPPARPAPPAPAVPDQAERRRRVLAHVDVSRGRGLEIGPLYAPVVTRDMADVVYVDVHLTPGLRAFYAAHPGTPLDEIVDVDVALLDGDRLRPLAEATAGLGPFDWVVASHVIEHVPDLIAWLRDVADVLVDGGRLALAVPDRRYCFDALRPETTVGQVLLAHHHGDQRPSVRAVFDHFHRAARVTAAEAWRGEVGEEHVIFPLAMARDKAARSVAEGVYEDCHVWLFTPDSLVTQLAVLAELGHCDFTVHAVAPTHPGETEFFVTLQRMPRDVDGTARRELVRTGFPAPTAVGADPGGPPTVTIAVSPLEQRLIERKRQVVALARGALARLRRR